MSFSSRRERRRRAKRRAEREPTCISRPPPSWSDDPGCMNSVMVVINVVVPTIIVFELTGRSMIYALGTAILFSPIGWKLSKSIHRPDPGTRPPGIPWADWVDDARDHLIVQLHDEVHEIPFEQIVDLQHGPSNIGMGLRAMTVTLVLGPDAPFEAVRFRPIPSKPSSEDSRVGLLASSLIARIRGAHEDIENARLDPASDRD